MPVPARPILAALLLTIGGTYACSGSSESSLPSGEDPAGAPGSAAPGDGREGNGAAPNEGSGTGAPGPATGGGTGGAGTGSSGGGDAGAATGEGGTGGGTGGGAKCPAGAAVEKEANDAPASANEIPGASGSFCGALSSDKDVDYVTFTLPADAKSIAFGSTFSKAGLEFEVTVDGKKFLVGETPEFKPGKRYLIRAFTTGSTPVDYRLDVAITR